MKENGADIETLMSLGGWSNPAMVARYGRAERTKRAVDAYRRLGSPIDRGRLDRGGLTEGARYERRTTSSA
jgi:hypothetical protein